MIPGTIVAPGIAISMRLTDRGITYRTRDCEQCGLILDGVIEAMDSPIGIQRCDLCELYPGDLEAAAALAALIPGAVVKFYVGHGSDVALARMAEVHFVEDAGFEVRAWNSEDLPDGEYIAAHTNPWIEINGRPIDWTTCQLSPRLLRSGCTPQSFIAFDQED